jgi:hypothetical protein
MAIHGTQHCRCVSTRVKPRHAEPGISQGAVIQKTDKIEDLSSIRDKTRRALSIECENQKGCPRHPRGGNHLRSVGSRDLPHCHARSGAGQS